MDIQDEIIRITSEYFEDHLDYQKLSFASKAYKDLLNEICEQDLDNDNGRHDIHLDSGKALGTFWAATCLDDLIRTRQFVRGINKAINEKIDEKGTLHILYAGTGPFATLILPLILRYSKSIIKYTLLEINPLSFEILKNVISKLGLEEYNIKLIKEDATKYQIDGDTPDIIISETMQNALDKEQQVSIFYNLMGQAKSDSIFIPEKIEIFVGLRKAGISGEELQIKHYHKQNKIFEVSKESISSNKQIENQPIEELTFPKKQTVIEKENLKGFNQIVLITEIQVFNDEIIRLNESGLTIPKSIGNISDNLKDSIIINTQYTICTEPKFEFEIVSPSIV